MEKLNGKYFIPKNITVGFYDRTVNPCDYTKHNSIGKRFGFCSCKWPYKNTWTECSTFKRITRGCLPHKQRDLERQIGKDLGETMQVFNNEPISGFRLLDSRIYDGHFKIEDPRGFCITLSANTLIDAVVNYGVTLSSGGLIDGEFIYVWKNETWNGIQHIGMVGNDHVYETDDMHSIGIKHKNLVPGKIYDVVSKHGDLDRYLFVGNFNVPSYASVTTFLRYMDLLMPDYTLKKIKSIIESDENGIMKKFQFFDGPWGISSIETTLKHVQNKTKKPVFIKLSAATSPYKHDRTQDFWFNHDASKDLLVLNHDICIDSLIDPANEPIDDAIKFSFGNYDQNLVIDDGIAKRICKESDCQDTTITDEKRIQRKAISKNLKSDTFATYKFDDVKNAVEKYFHMLDYTIETGIKMLIPDRPTCGHDMKIWAKTVFDILKPNL